MDALLEAIILLIDTLLDPFVKGKPKHKWLIGIGLVLAALGGIAAAIMLIR